MSDGLPRTCSVMVLASQSTVQHLIDPSSPALSTRLRSHFPVSVPWEADGLSRGPRCMVLGQNINPKMPLGCACNPSAIGRKRSSSHGVLLLLGGAAFVKLRLEARSISSSSTFRASLPTRKLQEKGSHTRSTAQSWYLKTRIASEASTLAGGQPWGSILGLRGSRSPGSIEKGDSLKERTFSETFPQSP